MADDRTMPPTVPPKQAHILMCPACENPTLVSALCQDSTAMQCPRCGTFGRPNDIWTFERVVEGDDV